MITVQVEGTEDDEGSIKKGLKMKRTHVRRYPKMTRFLKRTEDDEVSGKKGIKVKRTKYDEGVRVKKGSK
jgi:hypothetical protein